MIKMSQGKEKSLLTEILDKIDSSSNLDVAHLTEKDERIQEIILQALAQKRALEIINQKRLEKVKEGMEKEEDEDQKLLELLTKGWNQVKKKEKR